MSELIDTTEMYLKTVYELEEDGVPPLRARIVERLDHSGPTVSQTVSRMERDGLIKGPGEPAGNVDPVPLLDPRQGEPVESGGQCEQGRGGQPGDDEPPQPSRARARGDVVRERQVPPHVPQPLGVVAVEQHR